MSGRQFRRTESYRICKMFQTDIVCTSTVSIVANKLQRTQCRIKVSITFAMIQVLRCYLRTERLFALRAKQQLPSM